jgi:hypothetical protein
MILQAGGQNLYTEYFSVISVMTQNDYWQFEIKQSVPPRIHGDLMVTIHPRNETWSSYLVYLPYAANVTAYEVPSKRTLDLVVSNKTGRVVVNFGVPRKDGYTFVLSFDLAWGLSDLSGGVFVFTWQESGWGTFSDGYTSVPGAFNITLPSGATFLDITGVNALGINPNVVGNSTPVVGFRATLLAGQQLGWRVLYRGSPYSTSLFNGQPSTNPGEELNVILGRSISPLPLTLGSLGLWTAVMCVFLLTASELLAPAYASTGVLINRRRLRIAVVILLAVFIAVTVYEISLLHSLLTQVGH